jgi:polysaccharide export outer membrane protein
MRQLIILIAISFLLGSCTVNKDLIFKTPKGYVYEAFPDTASPSATLSPNNMLQFNFFTGNGHMLVEQGLGNGMLGGGGGAQQNQMMMQRNQISYLIDRDGTAKMPVIGRVKLEGLTIREAETKLEELYSQYYNEPFVMLNVDNNRVIVSPGAGGTSQVINLVNNNTTLMEALSMVGGVASRGNSSKIKLIRLNEETKERDIYAIDLSTIDGLQYADIIIQPNDIIYVEPLPLIASELVQEIAPVLTLLTTAILVLTILNVN